MARAGLGSQIRSGVGRGPPWPSARCVVLRSPETPRAAPLRFPRAPEAGSPKGHQPGLGSSGPFGEIGPLRPPRLSVDHSLPRYPTPNRPKPPFPWEMVCCSPPLFPASRPIPRKASRLKALPFFRTFCPLLWPRLGNKFLFHTAIFAQPWRRTATGAAPRWPPKRVSQSHGTGPPKGSKGEQPSDRYTPTREGVSRDNRLCRMRQPLVKGRLW